MTATRCEGLKRNGLVLVCKRDMRDGVLLFIAAPVWLLLARTDQS